MSYSDFRKFAISNGISSSNMDSFEKEIYGSTEIISTIQASKTPYVIDKDPIRATQIDIFSRLMMDRILWVTGVVGDGMCDILQAQLMFLGNTDPESDINMYINTPGGSVSSGLSIRDVMNFVPCDVSTLNLGICASMGSILVSSGTKGKRSTLPMSKVMLHQVSYGTQGNIQDTRQNINEAEKFNFILFKILEENSNLSFKELMEVTKNDHWLSPKKSIEYGLIDNIISNKDDGKKIKTMDDYLEGDEFKNYLSEYVHKI